MASRLFSISQNRELGSYSESLKEMQDAQVGLLYIRDVYDKNLEEIKLFLEQYESHIQKIERDIVSFQFFELISRETLEKNRISVLLEQAKVGLSQLLFYREDCLRMRREILMEIEKINRIESVYILSSFEFSKKHPT